jgi:hypothetical protein
MWPATWMRKFHGQVSASTSDFCSCPVRVLDGSTKEPAALKTGQHPEMSTSRNRLHQGTAAQRSVALCEEMAGHAFQLS